MILRPRPLHLRRGGLGGLPRWRGPARSLAGGAPTSAARLGLGGLPGEPGRPGGRGFGGALLTHTGSSPRTMAPVLVSLSSQQGRCWPFFRYPWSLRGLPSTTLPRWTDPPPGQWRLCPRMNVCSPTEGRTHTPAGDLGLLRSCSPTPDRANSVPKPVRCSQHRLLTEFLTKAGECSQILTRPVLQPLLGRARKPGALDTRVDQGPCPTC